MAVFNNVLAGAAGQAGGAGGYEIERSVRFNDDDGASLTKTFSAGTTGVWTWSFWVKRSGSFTTAQALFSAPGYTIFGFEQSGELRYQVAGGSSIKTAAVYEDPSAWYHIVLAADSGISTVDDQVKLYVNGEQVTEFISSTFSGPGSFINSAVEHSIGKYSTSSRYFDGYLAEVYFIDGQGLAPTDFGEFDANGVWQPIAYAGSYGTNGYHLDFSDSSTVAALGTDTSGNGNDWTVNNISNGTTTSFNLDVTSTPFTDIGRNISITNLGTVGTISAGTNSFNLTTVASFGGSGSGEYLRTGNITIGSLYTFDYYFNTNTSQVGNATVIDGGAEAVIRDYGSATSRNIRINGTDYSYSVSADTWNHVRVSNTGIWVNGTLITGSPQSAANKTNVFYIGTYNNSTSYLFNGEIGPVRISDEDLGAPPSGGLVANTDGTLSNVTGFSNDTDVFFDSPTNGTQTDTGAGGEVSGNYCTFNPTIPTTHTLVDGNLTAGFASGTGNLLTGTLGVSSGKWYWEFTVNSGNLAMIGIADFDADQNSQRFNGNGGLYYYQSGGNLYGGLGKTSIVSGESYGSSYTSGDIIGVALDMDSNPTTLVFYKNNTSQGTATNATMAGKIVGPSYTNGGGATNISANFGQRPFAYTAPSGFKALCTANLDDPTIADGSTAMDVALYTGNGSTQTISGLNFSPDLVWIKARDSSTAYQIWFDRVRGEHLALRSENSAAEADYDANGENSGVSAFGTDSFSVTDDSTGGYSVNGPPGGTYSGTSGAYVAWAWDAGTSTVSNTDGSITSSVRANPSAGFSIVSYTGNGAASGTIGHGLNAAPEFIMVKNRDVSDEGRVYHVGTDATSPENYFLKLFAGSTGTAARSDVGAVWNDTAPTTSVFSVGTEDNVNASNEDYIAYCFTSVEGYSAFGSYTGNGSATDGPFVYTGFSPKWLLVKESSNANNWFLLDATRSQFNYVGDTLWPNLSNQENDTSINPDTTYNNFDFLSNGFKARSQYTGTNRSTGSFIYAAFAENPFKTARAR